MNTYKLSLLTAIIALTTLFAFDAQGQNRAPSVYMDYNDNFEGDIIMNTLNVVNPSPLYTFHAGLQFNPNAAGDGGGYGGMQEHPSGRNFIFSLWDPGSTSDTIKAVYQHPATTVTPFGGEGTGLKSLNFGLGWETDQWYSIVSRVWDDGGNSNYGYWVYDHTEARWHHVVTMAYPVPGLKFGSKTSYFIEDWLGNGSNVRECKQKEGWKRRTSDGTWGSFDQGTIVRISPDAGAINYIDNYAGGVAGDYYFTRSGGTTTPGANVSGTTVSLPNSNTGPGFSPIVLNSVEVKSCFEGIGLTWANDSSTLPQFSYTMEFYSDPSFSGSPVTAISDIKPHTRALGLSLLIDPGTYYYKFWTTDIFGNQSNTLTGEILKYCDVSGGTADEWLDTFEIGSATNVSGDNGGYKHFDNAFDIALKEGNTYPVSFTPGFSGGSFSEYYTVWIDYNQDGDFEDANEKAFDSGSSSSTTVTGDLTVPIGVFSGQTRMRVQMKYLSPDSSCATFTYGEVEDYCVRIDPACATLCTSTGGTIDEWIESIQIGPLDLLSGNNGGYANWGISTMDTFVQGSDYNFTLIPGYAGTIYPEYWRVWLDVDQDGSFNSSELIYDQGASASGPLTGTLTIPAAAMTGTTSLRVQMKYNAASDACEEFTYGEVEDFCITISEGENCNPAVAPTGMTASVGGSLVNLSWNTVSGSLGCQLNGGPVPVYPGLITLPFPGVSSYSIPVSTLAPGSYNVRIRCACQLSPTISATPFSTSAVFTIPEPRLGVTSKLEISPNPASSYIQGSFEATVSGESTLQVFDMLGREMLSEQIATIEGLNQFNLDVSSLANGSYLLHVTSGEKGENARFIERFELMK